METHQGLLSRRCSEGQGWLGGGEESLLFSAPFFVVAKMVQLKKNKKLSIKAMQ